MRPLSSALVLAASVTGASLFAAFGCGSSDALPSTFIPDAGDPIEASPTGFPETGPSIRDDFKSPVFDSGATPSAVAVFANADGSGGMLDGGGADGGVVGGPCLYEPEMGTLFPSNWLRPRFRFTATTQENLFQITLVVPNQVDPLVIYTTQSGYILDKSLWSILALTGTGTVHVTIRSASVDASGNLLAGPFKGTEGDIEIAPNDVEATGSVVYWTTSDGTVLKGFKMGDETVQPVITPAAAQTQCVACHTSTPDGLYAGLTGSQNAGDGGQGYITIRSVDGMATEPTFLSAPAKTLLLRNQWAPAFSKSHWADGDHTMLSMMNVTVGTTTRGEIIWTDLEAKVADQGTGWNTIVRTSENAAAASVMWSHDGTKIVYTETSASGDGVIATDGQIHIVPYANRAGGTPTAVTGASDPMYNNYYPNFSADDQLIAFNRVPTGQSSYNDPAAEIYVTPASSAPGITGTRLKANDPPACLGKTSPGLTNSWGKFSPQVATVGSKSYYFIVFSSTRNPASMGGPQLYVAPVVVDGTTITTYSALSLWNQPETEHNHTPAWDIFQLPGPG